jgi:6-phosphogluconolactonase
MSTAQVLVEPTGRFVYVSNRGHDTIAIFTIDQATGRVTPVGHTPTGGRTPRNFAIDPAGRFLYAANQDSDTIVCFRIDPGSGALTPTGSVTPAGTPVCVLFGPA